MIVICVNLEIEYRNEYLQIDTICAFKLLVPHLFSFFKLLKMGFKKIKCALII